MISKRALALFLAGAGGVPYIFSSSSGLQDWATSPLASEHEVIRTAAHTSNTDPGLAHASLPTGPSQPPAHYSEMLKNGHGITPFSGATNIPLEGTGVQRLEDVFNFDATVPWILGHWARVSTILADLNLKGYRVPLVTGTSESDVAGSLTYYFNPQQQLQRITFTGSSGDTRNLVEVLVARHGFKRELTSDAGLFLYSVRDAKQANSELKIRPVAIVRSGDPRQRFEIDLVMNRPVK